MNFDNYLVLKILPTNFKARGNMARAIGGPTTRLTTSRCTHIERKFGLNPVYETVMTNDRAVAIDILIIKPRTILGFAFFILAVILFVIIY
jgi:hypothetical protein